MARVYELVPLLELPSLWPQIPRTEIALAPDPSRRRYYLKYQYSI